jgi:hypothetical protein
LIPRPQLFQLLLRVKRRQCILLSFRRFLVLNIEPFIPPILNRIYKGEFEELHVHAQQSLLHLHHGPLLWRNFGGDSTFASITPSEGRCPEKLHTA